MMAPKRKISRRTFIKGTAATAAALGSPWLLNGCGSGSSDNSGSYNATLHFDLSHTFDDEEFTLHIGGHERTHPLQAHTTHTRALHRDQDSSLLSIPDSNLTHYAPDVELPNRVAMKWVTHTVNNNPVGGTHGLALVAIHIPPPALASARSSLRRRGLSRAASASSPDADSHKSPMDTAKTLVFNHPDLLSMENDHAAMVMVHIENYCNAPGQSVYDLAMSIYSQGHATAAGGWAILEPLEKDDGTPILDSDGEPIYNYRPSDLTLTKLGAAVQAVVKAVKNDLALEGLSWHADDGTSSVDGTTSASSASAKAAASARSASALMDTSHLGMDFVESFCGISTAVDPATTNSSTLGLDVANYWHRHASCFVQYYDNADNLLSLDSLGLKDQGYAWGMFNTEYSLCLGSLSPRPSVFGVPVWWPSWVHHGFEAPFPSNSNISRVKVLYGGVGTWGARSDENWKIAELGIGLTLIMSYALPGLLLAMASPAGPDWYKGMMDAIKKAIKNPAIIGTLAALGVFVEGAFTYATGTPDNAFTKSVLKFAGNKGGTFIIDKGAQWLFPEVVKLVTEKTAEKAIPFAGWVLYAAESAGSIAEMVETTVECIMSPWVNQNGITFAHDVQVTIQPDTKHPGSFPTSATKYRVTLHVQGKNDRVIERSLADPAVNEIIETFEGIPMGRRVKASVAFYSANDWLAGQGETALVANVTPAGVGTLAMPAFNIEEQQIPLTLDSVYSHYRKLGFDGTSHQWSLTSAAPTATRMHLSCSSAPGSLCELNGITVSQMAAVLGYSWKASGQGVNDCTSGGAASQLSTLQNVSTGVNPDASLLFSGCGFLDKPNVVYDLLGDASGNHFYIDPRGGEFHLRKMNLTATGMFAPSAGQSYGRFSLSSDSLVCYKNYVISVNKLKSKIEVLEVPDTSFADADAPVAAIMSGEGNRQGLLHHPVAVAADSAGTIYILEEQNARVQAFDVHGNPVARFANGAYSFALKNEGGLPVRYLDIGVEYTGYVYVLSYTDYGTDASDYNLDIYAPEGVFLVRTPSFVAGKISVDYWRNVFSLNYETFSGPGGRTEPGVSQWTPPAPSVVAALSNSIVIALRKGTRALFLS